MRDFFEKVAALRRGGQRFATATVVGRSAPVSAHLGDHAIVYTDGRMEGFIGGACSREIVRKQALDAIRTRHGRLVSIRPGVSAASGSDEHLVVPMSCVSEGGVDVFVEPNVRPRRLVIVGLTPIADALTRTAMTVDYDVVRVVRSGEMSDLEHEAAAHGFGVAPLETLEAVVKEENGEAVTVVATQGDYDEQALEAILRAGASYVGLVASRARGAAVRKWLAERAVRGAETVRNPAGLDLRARTAPEVALSILAEIVKTRAEQTTEQLSPSGQHAAHTESTGEPAIAIDPVCHMQVAIATAVHTTEVGGMRYYFCSSGCRTRFVADPDRFLAARS